MTNSSENRVLVAGAGLAGLTTALRLQKQGKDVTVFEKKPHAGGRVYSFTDDQTGDPVDNGQHVYLGCCSALRSLLKEAGCPADEHIQDQLRLVFQQPDGEKHILRESNWLPAPLHLLSLLLNASFLSWTERYCVATCFLKINNMEEQERKNLDNRSMASWLREQGQSQHAIDSFWDVFIVSTLNARAEQVSAALAIFVFQEGLLSAKDAGRIGLADRGQTPFYVTPLLERIEELGGQVKFRTPVKRLVFDRTNCAGVRLENGEVQTGEKVVLALPPWRLEEILERSDHSFPLLDNLEQFDPAPIVCVNVWLTEKLVREPFVSLIGDGFDWIFHRNDVEHRSEPVPQHLSLVKSAAFDELKTSLDDLKETALDELSLYYDGFQRETVTGIRVTKEPRATFLPHPGLQEHRPSQDPPVAGLYLAGAWTDTGWPSTMESAVRSGNRVASLIQSGPNSSRTANSK